MNRAELVADVPWGEVYGRAPSMFTDESHGSIVTLRRRGQRARWYDQHGNQVGPEQTNVAPAIAYATAEKWLDYEGHHGLELREASQVVAGVIEATS